MIDKPFIGAHFSTAGGLQNAVFEAHDHNCNAVQIFTKNSRTWKEKYPTVDEINRFLSARKETRVHCVVSHASYLINLGAREEEKLEKSRSALKNELIRSGLLQISDIVLHPGSHMNKGEKTGIRTIVESIDTVFEKLEGTSVRLLLETTSGQGTNIGHRFEHLAEIIARSRFSKNMGACLDTCHIFTAGYDIRTDEAYEKTMNLFDNMVGIDRLRVIHLNDSRNELASRVDRHEHIGRGCIGDVAFRRFMTDPRLARIPKIIETPKRENKKAMDPVNLERLKELGSRSRSSVHSSQFFQ
ncbi:MAG: deoxyribonuclease IV [Desulfarculaceae bacterium]|nr:deoxyribonuclease IV [Desulfarculaceae bacterium]